MKRTRRYNGVKTKSGRKGWRLVFRDAGQGERLTDYNKISHSKPKKFSAVNGKLKRTASEEKAVREALAGLHQGGFVTSEVFLLMCKKYNVKLTKWIKAQLIYICELEVSVSTIRHKNKNVAIKRRTFGGLFSAIEYMIAVTIDEGQISDT